ncbi:tRNA N(3)-methylcytidine methyltransferase METTL2 [Nematocida sp. LUAm3]|nr:tRNA N(3)-methylcytidine methyltransferase METTL2 [Nematocida sp. LUAm3]KAI5173906.1 tRNA N(3)-methylcytidine methyltransferase METTL2 [Nematocida sp. LUAm2]KAI5177349.1 tRNA N(3)-methylcytidine methyltransferase METTL2 [Nematocida sp. LUAm1]
MRNRVLVDPQEKYSENAWDYADISEETKRKHEETIRKQEESISLEQEPISYESWDTFYSNHQMSFFKERKWILSEFPELQTENKRIFEVGCGTGSTLSQISPKNQIFGIDCSITAINIIKNREIFQNNPNFSVHSADSNTPFPYKNMDHILLIFTLSAIHPSSHKNVILKIKDSLNQGGTLLFRDYAEMDLTQIRFKPHQILQKNLYKRGEGTYAYFFTKNYLEDLLKSCGFQVTSCIEDKRLLINRKKHLEMPRNWLQITAKKQ